ncbi:hypothetical protein [Mucilaginibacter sp. SP1R1]|uniref:hypothetical protein n=1 Tax=Mucilaginibacter sp. SP1R1 TaxID=2723091 RepID=UPI001608C47B|nr:hypothetical protein [Mucilaginibacter sp. SP1R1]MBB6148786.1 hypothetical protein [Mucilaginibacter sp. SP1R1]
MKTIQTLKFYWLRYDVSVIEEMIANSPSIDNFVFSYYFPTTTDTDTPLQLIANAHMSEPVAHYGSDYDILSVYKNNALELSGPVILSNNIIALADIQFLINTPDNNNLKPDYLVFVPDVTDTYHVYYNIQRYRKQDDGDVIVSLPNNGGGDYNTNPSPPATMTK